MVNFLKKICTAVMSWLRKANIKAFVLEVATMAWMYRREIWAAAKPYTRKAVKAVMPMAKNAVKWLGKFKDSELAERTAGYLNYLIGAAAKLKT